MTATTEQLSIPLHLAPLKPVAYEPEATNADKWAAFHSSNPHVADALEHLAEQWFAAGNTRVGVRALWERLRWEVGVVTSESAPSLNNNYPPFYSRLLLDRRPEWVGRIRQRKAQADQQAVA